MGIVEYSFGRDPESRSTYEFLDFCHALGARGACLGYARPDLSMTVGETAMG